MHASSCVLAQVAVAVLGCEVASTLQELKTRRGGGERCVCTAPGQPPPGTRCLEHMHAGLGKRAPPQPIERHAFMRSV